MSDFILETSILESPILESRGLTKHYGGVHALSDASFALKRG